MDYYGVGEEPELIRRTLQTIRELALKSKEASVLLLGRYRFIEPNNLAELKAIFPSLSIRFMTMHGSKGQEADHVIVLRATSNNMGIPSEIVDDPVLEMVMPEPETYDHAEERRLFYVALTRALSVVRTFGTRELVF